MLPIDSVRASSTQSEPERRRQTISRFTTRSIAVRLFATCWLIFVLHFATNTVREIYPALSLGDHLSFDVSEYMGLHPDIFELPGRGAFINNTPGASILGAVPYVLTRPVIDRVVERVKLQRAASQTPAPDYDSVYPLAREFYRNAYERGLDIKFGLAAGVMQALLMAPLSALSAVVMFYVLQYLTGSRRKALWLALLYAFATPVFYRTAQLNHNLLQAHFAFFAFVALWRPWASAESGPSWRMYLLAGLLTGYTVVLDYSGVIIVAALSGYAFARWWTDSNRRLHLLVAFGAGVAACAVLLMGYQWVNFGHPLYPAQYYMPATTYSGYGYQGMTLPQPDLLGELAFGIRYGLFTSAPLLVLSLYPAGWLRGRMRLVANREALFVLTFTTMFFLFTAANQFSRMQFNSGVRHIVPVVPFLFLIAAGVLLRLPRTLAITVGVIATYWSWCLAMYRDVELGLGIFESLIHISTEGPRLPWLTTLELMGYVPSAGGITLLLLIGAGVLLLLIWRISVPIGFRKARIGVQTNVS